MQVIFELISNSVNSVFGILLFRESKKKVIFQTATGPGAPPSPHGRKRGARPDSVRADAASDQEHGRHNNGRERDDASFAEDRLH